MHFKHITASLLSFNFLGNFLHSPPQEVVHLLCNNSCANNTIEAVCGYRGSLDDEMKLQSREQFSHAE